MSASLLKEHLNLRADVVPLNVDQYHQMIAKGILAEGEPIELLDGFLIRKDRSKKGADPMTVGHHHAWAVAQLMQTFFPFTASHGCHIRIQQPVTIPPDHEPEPDAVIARNDASDFKHGHPRAEDIFCIVEVADSSLQRDRTTKHRIYAEANIAQYVIVNLVDGVVEEYRDPAAETGAYLSSRSYRKGDTIPFAVGGGRSVSVPAADLLP